MTLVAIREGGKRAVAEILSAIEADPFADRAVAVLDAAYAERKGHVLGITGPPGAGKSTLIDVLVRELRAKGQTVAVLAVDPSSKRTGGALLGDRVRMRTDPTDVGVFVRSIAAKTRLGGLARTVFPSVVVLRALFDIVIVESVGVGQSETDVTGVADTIILCIQPGSGDSLQFMKAGILEIPHIAVVTKADTGASASRALADVRGALSLVAEGDKAAMPVCLAVSSATGLGVPALLDELAARQASGSRTRGDVTPVQLAAWLEEEIATEFGRRGLTRVQDELSQLKLEAQPFAAAGQLLARLDREFPRH
jgi:LAO/AO transport system kinase